MKKKEVAGKMGYSDSEKQKNFDAIKKTAHPPRFYGEGRFAKPQPEKRQKKLKSWGDELPRWPRK